jgi:hypothetical protein
MVPGTTSTLPTSRSRSWLRRVMSRAWAPPPSALKLCTRLRSSTVRGASPGTFTASVRASAWFARAGAASSRTSTTSTRALLRVPGTSRAAAV